MNKIILLSIIAFTFSSAALAQNNQTSSDSQTQAEQDIGSGQPADMSARKARKDYPYSMQADSDLAQYDKDQDRKLSRDEAEDNPDLAARWVEFDINADDSIDTTEYYLFSAHRHIETLEESAIKSDSDDMDQLAEEEKSEESQ